MVSVRLFGGRALDWQKCLVSLTIAFCLGVLGCAPSSSTADTTDVLSDGPDVGPSQAESLENSNSLTQAQGQMLPITAEVQLGDQTIGLEVAQTRQQQAIGLMFRDTLADDHGMLFPFAPPRPVRFWMKNVSIPLDMVFLYQGEVVEIAHDVPPCESEPCPTYGPDELLVEYVIELRGGLAELLGLQVGDVVEIQWLETAP
ncbi:MAG: DUF192 domain-containing protein [Cyanobacteria bacterium P01_F01_bin.86]